MDDAHPKMRFSLSPPPPKAICVTSPSATHNNAFISSNNNSKFPSRSNSNSMLARSRGGGGVGAASGDEATSPLATAVDNDAASDYNQWLHAMKLVARLPGGTPPEFRRKLWLSLADKYLKSKNVDWSKEQEKCFCEEWREDDEELGIQIVKDLHRTGSNLCTGPAGSINQAKLKRILLGYARYNPEVGYCQGFNMLGALILQVMDKEEIESMKVMIYLVEGVLPTGYFCGSMGGLQADMSVFRELMQTKLPRLAKHLQKLQGPVENAYEPPLTNVFTMQWFLTMFCTCLPMSCVLRVWDLVLIEGSDILLRTALVLWGLLEDRVLNTRTADDFYGKMGSFSSELLNGHLIDSNGLIERVVQLGPIPDIQKLRDKHLYNITPLRHKQGLQLYYDDEDMHSDEESRLAVATVWGIPWGRRGSSSGHTPGAIRPATTESKDRLALDISLLKKQYDRLRERQKQAHVILTTACTTAARQGGPATTQAAVPVSQLLMGRPAIVTNKGKRVGPPVGAIPPARKPSLPAVLQVKPAEKQLRRGETLHWRDTELSKRRRDSMSWKEIKADRQAMLHDSLDVSTVKSQKLRSRLGKSDSSSYSEESEGGDGSSTDTSLCDEDDRSTGNDKSLEQSPKRKAKISRKLKDLPKKELPHSRDSSMERKRPKSWAPTTHEIPFMLMKADSPIHSADEKKETAELSIYEQISKEEEDSATESDRVALSFKDINWPSANYSPIAEDLASSKLIPLQVETEILVLPVVITSTSQLSPLPDISTYLNSSSISPLPTPKPLFVDSISSLGSGDGESEDGKARKFDVNDDGVTNEYFERVNSVERPTKLELFYSLNDENRNACDESVGDEAVEGHVKDITPPTIEAITHDISVHVPTKEDISLKDHIESRKLSAPTTEEVQAPKVPQVRDDNIPGENKNDYKEVLSMTINDKKSIKPIDDKKTPKPPMLSSASRKRRDPRRMTLTRSSTIELEERFQELERRLSQDLLPPTNNTTESTKRIPTTADLEARYNTLEKQLSADRQAAEKELISQTAVDSSVTELEIFNKPNKERIPSTADLENRYNALAKQMSSSGNDAKEPIELKDGISGDNEQHKNESEETNKLHKAEESKLASKSNIRQSETQEAESNSTTSNVDKPRLKKLPSTAELEDRFNALERKMSVEKSSAPTSKKEPPDEPDKSEKAVAEELCQESKGASASATTSDSRVSKKKRDKNEEPENNEKLKDEKNVSEKQLEKISAEVKSPKKENTKSEPANRKAPPSTEELEKRFEALEKRMSITAAEEPEAQEKPITPTEKVTDKNASGKEASKTAEENQRKPTKDFNQKCLDVNEKLSSEIQSPKTTKPKPVEQQSEESSKMEKNSKPDREAIKSKQCFLDKCKAVNETMSETQKPAECERAIERHQIAPEAKPNELSKRRASEPPSTEDLEKRYETLKRRMSTRTFSKDSTNKCETVEQALQRIEQEVIAEIGESTTEMSESSEKKQLPTTEDLESRYDALHLKDEKHEEFKNDAEKSLPKTPANTPKSTSPAEKPKPTANTTKHVDVAIEAHIPEAPPMPEVLYNKSHVTKAQHPARHQQRALIEELQSKIKGQPGEENLKPSEINPQHRNRISHRPRPMGDETSEAPANTAYYRSENYETWHPSKRMVRRFSDLPSRADLENRLQFLEKQLYKKFYKQRCASDSEVASIGLATAIRDEMPSTSKQATDLEQRVLALEKQLSENSLKLLEAMRAKAAPSHAGSDGDSPQRLSTETFDTTGKELVRYTHFGEVEESDTHKPINISINIKMLLNKEGDDKKRKSESLPNTDELKARVVVLEQQLSEERAKNLRAEEPIEEEILLDNIDDNKEIQPDKLEQNEKVEKDTLNQVLKCDSQEKGSVEAVESPKAAPITQEEVAPEAVKEVKTLENKERMRSAEEPKEKEDSAPEIVQVTAVATTEVTELPTNMIINSAEIGPVDPNSKTLVLLMDNEPKEVKVRRLTRANTEELEGLFEALEKQLSERNLIKSEDGKLIHATTESGEQKTEESKAITALSNEIQAYAIGDQQEKKQPAAKETLPKEEIISKEPAQKEPVKQAAAEDYDWGPDPIKRHLKRKTVHLPSTKELEARFRSLERQIKLLEEVEKIDVEQRLNEIERKIKLQYSLSHEEDLNKFLDLCEGKGLDDEESEPVALPKETYTKSSTERSRSPGRKQASKSPYTSPTHSTRSKTPHISPARTKTPESQRSPYTSPARKAKSPYTSPVRRVQHPDAIPVSEDLEYRYRVLDLVRSKSKENLAKRKIDPNKPPIHPLEMLLDPSPDDSSIPTTGELEHRIRVLDDKLKSPSRNPRSRSPTIEDIKRKKMIEDKRPKTPVHDLERMVASPTKPEPPTADELEARVRALEEEQSFDFKSQKKFKEFNQKLKDVVSPSLSFEEFKTAKSREQSPRRGERVTTPRSALRDTDWESRRDEASGSGYHRPISPKVIRFRDEEEDYFNEEEEIRSSSRTERMVGKENNVLDIIAENTKILERILKKTLADRSNSNSNISGSTSIGAAIATAASSEGLDALGTRLMRETSPLRRTGTHTGIPLRTGDNINDRLTSIKNTIKSIDTLCEEKPYQKEKCQRYIDSLFSDSLHFASKKPSLEDLQSQSRSESRGRGRSEYTPAIRITSTTEPGQRSSEYRSLGSAESIRTTSPLRAASPLHHRSNRDLRRETSPRSRRDEEREEYESSRVRRDNMLPIYFHDNRSDLSSCSSLTKFHKVDRQLESYTKYDENERQSSISRSASRSPLRSPYESRDSTMPMSTQLLNTSTTNNTQTYHSNNSYKPSTTQTATSTRLDIDRPVSPYRQPTHNNLLGYDSHKRSNTTVYAPAKLEIRHTTVTSTFYDRLLTEKQIEKSLTRPPSRSPVISPSVTSKSYNDLLHCSSSHLSTVRPTYGGLSTPTAIEGISTSNAIHTLSNSSYMPGDTSLPSYSNTNSTHAMPINHLSTPTSIDLRIRSCDNILAQLSSSMTGRASVTTPTTTSSTTSIYSTAVTAAVSSSIVPSGVTARSGLGLPGLITVAPAISTISPNLESSANLNTTSSAYITPYTSVLQHTSGSASMISPLTGTGVYNPIMPLTLRPAPDIGAASNSFLSQYKSNLGGNTYNSSEQTKM